MAQPFPALAFHRFCLVDKACEVFRQAIFQTVKAGDVVVDLGAGTGVLAYFACQAGAGRVYAVESDDVIRLAGEISVNNGFQDQVVLIQDMSFRVRLPERADILVTNTLESFGLNGGILGSVIDARKRLLKENAVIVPHSIELYVAPVELPELYQQHIDFWDKKLHELDFSSVLGFATNNHYPVRIDHTPFLGEPALLTRIDLYKVDTSDIRVDISALATKSGVMHGFVAWFAAELAEGIRFSNEPGLDETEYAQSFFPLDRPMRLEEGDRLTIQVQSYNSEIWRWTVECFGRQETGEDVQKWRSDQSNFKGFPLSKEDLCRNLPNYHPKLSQKGRAEQFVLGALTDERTVSQIEQELVERYPDTFYSPEEAAVFVKNIIRRCT